MDHPTFDIDDPRFERPGYDECQYMEVYGWLSLVPRKQPMCVDVDTEEEKC